MPEFDFQKFETNQNNLQILDILNKLDEAKRFLDKSQGLEETIANLGKMELYLRRFGSLKDLVSHLLFIERKIYMIKEYLSVHEAADYICSSVSQIYKLTSKHEIPYYKPNGKTVFIRREDLNNWIEKNKVLSNDNIEEQISIRMLNLSKGCNNNKSKL